jgi:hypothetical protein
VLLGDEMEVEGVLSWDEEGDFVEEELEELD